MERYGRIVERKVILFIAMYCSSSLWAMEPSALSNAKKLFFGVYSSRSPQSFIVEEFTDASVAHDARLQEIFQRMQQGAIEPFMVIDNEFAVYVSLSQRATDRIQLKQLQDFIHSEIVKKNIGILHHADADRDKAIAYIITQQQRANALYDYALHNK